MAYQDELSWSDRPPSLDEIVGWKRTHLILDPDGSLPEENRVEDFDDVRQREMTGFDHRTRDWKFYLVVRTVCEGVAGEADR